MQQKVKFSSGQRIPGPRSSCVQGFVGWTERLKFAGQFLPSRSVLRAAERISQGSELGYSIPTGQKVGRGRSRARRAWQCHPWDSGCWRFPAQRKFGRVELPTQSSRKARDAQGKEMDERNPWKRLEQAFPHISNGLNSISPIPRQGNQPELDQRRVSCEWRGLLGVAELICSKFTPLISWN